MNPPPPLPTEGTVLVVDDLAANRDLLRQTLEPLGYEILTAPDGESALRAALRSQPDVILLDVLMPGLDGFETCRRLKRSWATRAIPVVFITARDDSAAVIEGFRAGGADYVIRPFHPTEVVARVRTHLEHCRMTRDLQARKEELLALDERLVLEQRRREQAEASLQQVDEQLSLISRQEARRWGVEALVGRSPAIARLLVDIRKLQALPSTPVLVTGESGTGKELVARAIHFGSGRGRAPFVPVNCSAVPADLAESLFFGHVKGAFSGATHQTKGYLEQAHLGTLFLDEIGDMPLILQAKLLRVLEGGVLRPVGAASEHRVDVRVVAATNADLQEEIAAGTFRSELYFRLAHGVLEIPPLRERREDIPLLAAHFLEVLGSEMGLRPPPLAPEATAALDLYDYPGNVRELKNLIERALIESGGAEILPEHLHFVLPPPPPVTRPSTGSSTAAHLNSTNEAPDTDEDRILDHVRLHGSIDNTRCRQLLGVGLHRAWYLLRKLHRAGLLHQDHSRRWAQYRLPSKPL
ncbi:MAG: sigma-54-dependent Fis family transcriptional regulator [Verrucomicrobiales bacterium]|nr:sigma-54-dependent Fis family transcriptional regulator [Verrucomicrobiales bacterium]